MTAIPGLNEALIRANAAAESFSRGRSYYDAGAVADLALRGNTLEAEVEGSQYPAYRVRVAFDQGGITSASCTCPYDWGGWCKHIVAALLACIDQREEIEERPALAALLAELDHSQLQALLLGMAERDPDLGAAIERQVGLLQLANAVPQSRASGALTRRSPIDQEAIRQQVRLAMRPARGGRYNRYDRYDYYDDESDPGDEAVASVRPLLDQAKIFLAAGDARSALAVLAALTAGYIDEGSELFDEIEEMYGSFEGSAVDFFGELAEAWAEALLSADLSEEERDEWGEQVAGWRDEAEDLGADDAFDIALTAAEQGWDYPPLQRVLAGEIGEHGAWEGESPDYADELALIRLRILERQGRHQEYLYLAEAEGQVERYVKMLARLGRTDEAIDEGLKYLATPKDALELASLLRERGELEGAVRIAEHGLALPAPEGQYPLYDAARQKAPLADWLTDVSAAMGDSERALRAATLAFRAAPSLNAFLKVENLAGEEWASIKPELLQYLRESKSYIGEAKVDIFLHEELIDDAIAAVKGHDYYQGPLTRVMDAALSSRPDWVIQTASALAQRIMGSGDAKHYDTAVEWLRRARDAYRAADRADEWRGYLQSIRSEHGRKYKLMGLLERLKQ
jgi:uncharacterized Zn finger protein